MAPRRAREPEPGCPLHHKAPDSSTSDEKVVNTEDGPLVKGRVSGVEVTFLIDTGANVTIVKPSVLNRINAAERPSLKLLETSTLIAYRLLPMAASFHF